MEWGNKFTTLMKDTELNLQRVKNRLSSARGPSPDINFSSNDKTRVLKLTKTDNTFFSSSTGRTFPNNTNFNSGNNNSGSADMRNPPHTLSGLDPNYGTSNIFSGTSLEPSSGVLMLLYEKLDNQANQMDKLSDSVKRIEEERDQYYKQVQNLKGELVMVNTRMAERGVHLETEQKIDSWRREMTQDMQDLQTQFHYLRTKNEDLSQNPAFLDLHREIQDLRRLLQSESTSIRNELETMKSRQLALEVTLDKLTVRSYDLNQSHKRLETSVASMQSLKHSRLTSSQGKLELSELRSSIRDIASKINNIEGSVQQEYTREKQKRDKISDRKLPDFSLVDSDLDLSDTVDLSISDLTLSPTHKGRTLSEEFDLTLDTDDLLSEADQTDIIE